MDKKFCDLCKEEIGEIDRVYFVDYGEVPTGILGSLGRNKTKKNEICRECVDRVGKYIGTIRK